VTEFLSVSEVPPERSGPVSFRCPATKTVWGVLSSASSSQSLVSEPLKARRIRSQPSATFQESLMKRRFLREIWKRFQAPGRR